MNEEGFLFYREFKEIKNRLDFRYYHPRYDKLLNLKNKIKFQYILPNVQLSREKEEKEKEGFYIEIGNIEKETGKIIEPQFIKNNKGNKKIKEEDILISPVRPYLRGFTKVPKEYDGQYCSSAFFVIRELKNIDKEYFYSIIRSKLFIEQTTRLMAGSSYPRIEEDSLNEIFILILSSNKQKVWLEEFSDYITKRNNLEKEYEELADKISKIILKKLKIKLKKERDFDYYCSDINSLRLDFDYNSPKYHILKQYENECKYPFIELDKLVDFKNESRNPLKKPNESFLYIDITNINTKKGVIIPVEMVGTEATSSRMRRVVHKNDIILSTTRPTRNAIAIIPEDLDNCICSTGFAVLECKKGINKDFLFNILRTKIINLELERNCSGSGYPAINMEEDLPKIKIPCPTSEEQLKIVNELEPIRKRVLSIDKDIEKLDREIEKKLDKLINL